MMKNKRVQKALSVLLSLSMVCALLLALAGCGSKETLEGNWAGEIDLTDQISEGLAASLDEETASYLELSGFVLTLNMSFDKKEFTMGLDEAAATKAVEALASDLESGLNSYFEDVIAEEGYESVDEYLADVGYESLSEYVNEALDSDYLVEELSDMMSASGTYTADGGQLTLDLDGEQTVLTFELKGSTLTLDSDEEGAMPIFPLTMKKK